MVDIYLDIYTFYNW